ncbi:MAG: hypothetical protein ACTSW6_04025 [Candidatus Baldrarchaeia archaeon]
MKMSHIGENEKVAYTWRIEGDNLIFTIYYPTSSELKALDPWAQSFWKIKLYEELLKHMKKHEKLNFVFDVKGEKETFYKYFEKTLSSLKRNEITWKLYAIFGVCWLITALVGDLTFWRSTSPSDPFNIIYDLILFSLWTILAFYTKKENMKLLNLVKNISGLKF